MTSLELRPERRPLQRFARRRWFRLLLVIGAIIVLVPVAVLVFIATYDWNAAKPWIVQHAGDAIGRPVTVQGDLDVAWQWRRSDERGTHWSPGFHVRAAGVRVANAEWARAPDAAALDALELDVSAWPLLFHRIDLPNVRFVGPLLHVERRADGSDNWTFVSPGTGAGTWTIVPGTLAFGAGEIVVLDAQRKLDLRAKIEPLAAPIEFGEHVDGDDPTTRREVIQRVGKAAAERLRDAAREREQRRTERGKAVAPPPYRFHWTATGTLAGMDLKGKAASVGFSPCANPSLSHCVRISKSARHRSR